MKIEFVKLTVLSCLSLTLLTSCAKNEVALAPEVPVGVEKSALTARVGEHLTFSIRWLGFEFGTGEIKVEGIEQVKGRDAYHISLKARSNKLIDLVYPVRDEHHSYVDVEHFHSLRYEMNLSEGKYRANELMEFDQENHTAVYTSIKNGTKKQIFIPKHAQDQLSAAFWLRQQAMKPGDTVTIPVTADEQNWDLNVEIKRAARKKIGDLGTFDALEIEPSASFQGIFIRRGKFSGWMSMDEKRLPLLMSSKIPVLGQVNIVLVEYEGW